jgi:hypothetical protein
MKWIFNSQHNVDTALAEVNAAFGCPYDDGNYKMDTWAIPTKHTSMDLWEFGKPHIEIAITVPFEEVENLPSDWWGEMA